MSEKRIKTTISVMILFLMVILLTGIHCADAVTWQVLPPYNFLWPLWSPALSPVDPVTGLPVPIVSELAAATVLPRQPGLAWNPIFDYPYFLYNSPVGLQYYDLLYGINAWPPGYSLDPLTGLPIPITPPVGYNVLPPTGAAWLQTNLPIANLAFLAEYPSLALAAYTAGLTASLIGLNPWLASLVYPTPSFSSLLTAAQILGYAPVAPLVAPVVPAPTLLAPAPTIIAPVLTAVAPPPTLVAPVPTPVVPPPPPLTVLGIPPTAVTPIPPPVVPAPVPTTPFTVITTPSTGVNFIILL